MSLAGGLRTPEGRPERQAALLIALALASALLSNALAGPARRLAWRPAPPPPPRPAAPSASGPEAAPRPVPSPAPRPGPRPSASAPAPRPAAPAKPPLREAFPPPADGAPVEISDAEALALHRAGAAFLDARRTALFEAGHVAGARCVSPWEDGVDAKAQAFADATFDPKDPVVIYCTGGDCRDSHLLAERLWPLGFRNLRIFKGGWPAWQALKGPVATGPEGPAPKAPEGRP